MDEKSPADLTELIKKFEQDVHSTLVAIMESGHGYERVRSTVETLGIWYKKCIAENHLNVNNKFKFLV